MNPPLNANVQNLINELSVEEKVALCSGFGPWSTKNVERLGLPAVLMSDGPHGPRWLKSQPTEPSSWDMSSVARLNTTSGYLDLLHPVTNFPSLSALGSSWNTELLYSVGKAIGEECRHLGIGLLMAPGINIIRHPLCGRAYEYLSEDPNLAGELAGSYVRGVQSSGVGATVKHYACNNAEYERLSMDSVVEERALREIYLSVFERVVKKGKPVMVMSSYNRVNGVYASENKRLLTDILRSEWDFEGVVVSDWWAVNDRVISMNAGLDLEMPEQKVNEAALLKAVKEGRVSCGRLDEACGRILSLVLTHGGLERMNADFDSHHALARKAAAESIVLLKNSDGILPFNKDTLGKVAVIGSFAKNPRYQGWGCSIVNPRSLMNPLNEIRAYAGDTLYADGYREGNVTNEHLLKEAREVAEKADHVILFVGLPESYETETHDRVDYDLPEAHLALIDEVAAVSEHVVVVLQNGTAVATEPWAHKVEAILEAWLGGEAGAGALADVLFGAENPSGRLAVTFPIVIEDSPGYLNFPGENSMHVYAEGIFVGYRYYEKKRVKTAYPFGYGLSYTDFSYSNLELSSVKISDEKTLRVSFDLTNIGKMRGAEVAQLYVKNPRSRLKRPLKELRNFAKVFLEPGESRRVTLELSGRDFSYYDDLLGKWIIDSGVYGLAIGSSSASILLEGEVEVMSRQVNFIPLTAESYCYHLFDKPHLLEAFKMVMVENGIWPKDVNDEYLQAVRQNFIPLFKSVTRQTAGGVSRELFDQWLAKVNQEALRLTLARTLDQ